MGRHPGFDSIVLTLLSLQHDLSNPEAANLSFEHVFIPLLLVLKTSLVSPACAVLHSPPSSSPLCPSPLWVIGGAQPCLSGTEEAVWNSCSVDCQTRGDCVSGGGGGWRGGCSFITISKNQPPWSNGNYTGQQLALAGRIITKKMKDVLVCVCVCVCVRMEYRGWNWPGHSGYVNTAHLFN